MSLESNLQRKRLDYNVPDGTFADQQDAEREGNNFDFLIKAGLAGAGLIGLYKTGLLRPAIKGFYEYGAKVAKHPEDFFYSKSMAFENWAKFDGMSAGMLRKLDMEDVKLPKNSVFRNGKLDVLKTMLNDAYDITKTGALDFSRTKTIINDTKKDIDILLSMTDKQSKITDELVKKYKNTDLLKSMNNLKEFEQEVSYKIDGSGHLPKTKAMEAFMENNTLTKAERELQLKRKGIRNVTVGDLFEVPDPDIKDKYGKVDLVLKEGIKDKLNLLDGATEGDHTYDKIKYFMSDQLRKFYDKDGKSNTMLSGWDKTKDLILDRGIYIEESTNNIIDTRMTNNIVSEVKRSFVSNFQVPGLNFNPVGSLFPDWARGVKTQDAFGVIQKTRIDPTLTKKGGRVTVGDVFGDDVVVINGNAYKANSLFRDEDIIERGLKLNDITYRETTGLGKMSDAIRKVAGLDFKELGELSPKEIDKLSPKKKFYYDMSRWLDIGGADLDAAAKREFLKKTKKVNPDDFDDYFTAFNPDNKVFGEWIKKFLSKDSIQPPRSVNGEHNYGDIFGEGFGVLVDEGGNKKLFREYLTSKKSYRLKDVKNGDKTLKQWAKQTFAGRDKNGNFSKDFTERSANIFNTVNSVEEKMSGLAKPLGLSSESKKSTGGIFKSIMLKRVLPIYGLLQLPGLINALSEPIFDVFESDKDKETGNQMNITKFAMSKIVKPVDLGFHAVKDALGLTTVAKTFEEFTPGFEQITEFPGIHALGITQTKEERKEWMEKGVDPVRKGRYWSLGNTPFTGGKIMYYRPNVYRRVAADVDFSDSKWGSRSEYYNNTWFPNPINPLAPLNHFVLDKNHYDKKHYRDRPYLQTSSFGSQIPLVGPVFGSTVGKIISPQQKMHQEYWNNGRPQMQEDETGIDEIISQQNRQSENLFSTIKQAFVDQDTIKTNYSKFSEAQKKEVSIRSFDIERAKTLVQSSYSQNTAIPLNEYKILPKNSVDSTASDLELYTTPSGSMSVVDIPDDMSTYEANQQLSKYSIKKFQEADLRPELNNYNPKVADYSDLNIQNQFITGLGEEFNNLANVFGMKGFETQAFVTGKANQDVATIEDSSYAYSFNKNFWDQNMGGLGDNFSEMFRRFVQKRNDNIEYINPIRNTMPSWMPGRDYFTDFKHGDPYSKIDNGEERLPGEGYERLWDIDMKEQMNFGIGSSFIGKTPEEIEKHLLDADDPFTALSQEVTEEGTQMHEAMEKEWRDSGYAINTEGRIEDKKNHILGFYDALVHDQDSETGLAIADIKTVSAKKFYQVIKENKPFYENKAQVNYYLWATRNTNSLGLLHYVNRDDPTQTYDIKFKFDENLLKENLTNLETARQNILKGLESGTISRAELYKPLDRLRILADVAPYSEEFRKIKAKISMEDLTPEEQAEITEINQRVKKQKEPIRVYDYKFKTANLTATNAKIKKLIDNDRILVEMNGKQEVVKMAGINVLGSNSKKFDEKNTEKQAAEKELRKFIRKGDYVQILYNADPERRTSKDSTRSIKAVINSRGTNLNRHMLKAGLATEEKDDESPAAIRARYSKNEIAFGSAMEKATHWFSNNVPYFGSKILQVRSPYEQYKKKEVYGKDFQSWSHPIRDFLTPAANEMAEQGPLTGVLMGAFIGSLFGKKGNLFGKLVGAGIGASVASIGKIHAERQELQSGEKWIPQRRKDQREMNEYIDMVKYVKNMKLYETYKQKAKKEDRIDVDKIVDTKKGAGLINKAKRNELEKFKKQVKLDYKHRKSYNFKYGTPDIDMDAPQDEMVTQINAKINELASVRTVQRTEENVIKALAYRQQAEETMYAFDKGDSLQNYLKALPKKDRQYYKYLAEAPEEEKEKILAIVPSYLKRGLQSAWGRPMDEKPSLDEYFRTHALPDINWVGWNESSDLEDVKVKMVHMNKLDPGEFDIWQDQIQEANEVNIPIPKINDVSSSSTVRQRLQSLLGKAGYSEARVEAIERKNKIRFDIKEDQRGSVSDAILNLNI